MEGSVGSFGMEGSVGSLGAAGNLSVRSFNDVASYDFFKLSNHFPPHWHNDGYTQSVRVEFKDPTIGTPTPSAASLAFYANVVQQYPGIQVLFIIDYTTLGAFPSPTAPDSEWSTYIANFGGRAGAIAAKFKGAVDLFEVRVDALRHKSLYCQGRCKTAGGAARGHQPKLCRVPVA